MINSVLQKNASLLEEFLDLNYLRANDTPITSCHVAIDVMKDLTIRYAQEKGEGIEQHNDLSSNAT